MARIRTIKPEFFTSEDIVELTPFARLLYVSIWCEADREGRFVFKPKTFKLRYFPADSIEIGELLDELLTRKLIICYGDGLAYVPKFLDHQHINPREAASVLPDPDASITREPRVNHAPSPDSDAQVGREGKESKYASSTRFDLFWQAYPKKKSKGDAEKAWAKIKPSEHLAEQILQAVQRATTSKEWIKNGGEFIPYPASWLNAKGWEDESGSDSAKPWEQ